MQESSKKIADFGSLEEAEDRSVFHGTRTIAASGGKRHFYVVPRDLRGE